MARTKNKDQAIDQTKEDMPAAMTATNEEAQSMVDSGETQIPEEAKMTCEEAETKHVGADYVEAMSICEELSKMKEKPEYDWKNTFNTLHGRARKLVIKK